MIYRRENAWQEKTWAERPKGDRLMRILSAAAVILLLTTSAYAQTPNINLIPELGSKTPEEKEQEAIKDKAYRESLKKIPDAKASSDPWGTVRSNEAPKAAAKAPAPAKPKPKAGSSAANGGNAAAGSNIR
jgi:hypothetical protein